MFCLSFCESVAYTLLFLVTTIVRGQTTTRLSAAPSYADGVFTSPNTAATQIFDQGIDINITWATNYNSVNLYLINGVNYDASKPLILGTTDLFFVWTVNDSGNNTLPFSFRAVNAEGSTDEQTGGGFYTGQFWIRDDTAATPPSTPTVVTTIISNIVPTTTTSSSSLTPTTTTTSQTTSSASSAASSTKSPATTTPPAATSNRSTEDVSTNSTKSPTGPSEPSSKSSAASTSASSQSSSEPPALATNTSVMSSANMQSPSGPSTGAIAGIVVGGVAVLALIIGASLFFRRQRRPSLSSRQLDLMEIQMAQEGHNKPVYTLRDPSFDSSVQKRPAELAEDDVMELPNYRSSRPHELPDYRSSRAHELQ